MMMMMSAQAHLSGSTALFSSSSRNNNNNISSRKYTNLASSSSSPTVDSLFLGTRRSRSGSSDNGGGSVVCSSLSSLDKGTKGLLPYTPLVCHSSSSRMMRRNHLPFPSRTLINTTTPFCCSAGGEMQSSTDIVVVAEEEDAASLQQQQQQVCCTTSNDAATAANGEGDFNELNGTLSSQINEIDDKSTEAPNSSTSQSKSVRRELVMLALPALGGQAIEPMVQLMETAYIGNLGSVELASAGVSISLFNIISKLFNIPLLSVATSFVAEDISKNASGHSTSERLQLSSVSTALLLAVGIGMFEATALCLGSGPLLSMMGISTASSMRAPAQKFLILRAFGAPAFVVSLALQGIFRGLKDTKTPVYCLGFGNFTAAFLFPILMYYYGLGVNGAAIATVASQYIVAFSMIWNLNKRAVILPPKLGQLQFGGYLKSGGFLIGRTLAVLVTMTLGTSMAARQGPVAMAAHQICLQVWLAVSLLTDALAASAQALIASYVSKEDYKTVKDLTHFVLKVGLVTGISLAVVLGLSFSSLAPLFTKDIQVLDIVKTGVLFVSASQPVNALAFIVDGLHYGVSDFRYAAISMMTIGAISSAFMLYAPRMFGLPGVWAGLTLFMGLRMVAGLIRLLDQRGPWWFLHRGDDDMRKAKVL